MEKEFFLCRSFIIILNEGWKETKVVIRFWILSLLFALIGLYHTKAEVMKRNLHNDSLASLNGPVAILGDGVSGRAAQKLLHAKGRLLICLMKRIVSLPNRTLSTILSLYKVQALDLIMPG